MFAPGQTSQVVTVQVKGDLLAGAYTHDQGDEFFYVNLINPRNGDLAVRRLFSSMPRQR